MTILLETVTPPKSGVFQIDFSVAGEIVVSADDARRSVGVYVGTMLADLLHAEAPILVLKDHGIFWRVPVILSTASLGRVGAVGAIDVDTQTGELLLDERNLHEIDQNAERLAAGAAL
ncbi:hypothetical protein [Candidatus Chloroploca sp. Khr17]|uniref:hypothetical protein n=1 Tax=Candidatus Chloroploca sp. Khr17 TaxID=2496869 RepID=UPI00101D41FD|nr:hypothetical protein [Candidatus Chloroploca sp. Khr17]